MSGDEYVLDTPVVREFVAGVRETIAASDSPAQACDAIRPRFAALLADADWLPARYQEGDPESGMGGGIGQWLPAAQRGPVEQSLERFEAAVRELRGE